MDIQVTFGSKEPEKPQDAASATQIITNDDILRAGASGITEALRLADNLDVAQQNSHDWASSAHGFDANLADKVLVLIDGRAVYLPLCGGVEWNVQDHLLEDIDRIEMISGPGGILWGSNAFDGVINIATKNAKGTQGSFVEQGAGNELEVLTAVRYRGVAAPGVYYRVYIEFTDRGSGVFADGGSASDSMKMGRSGFRVDSEASPQTILRLQGDLDTGNEDLGSLGFAGLSGGNILGRWTHTVSANSGTSLQLYYDRIHLSLEIARSIFSKGTLRY